MPNDFASIYKDRQIQQTSGLHWLLPYGGRIDVTGDLPLGGLSGTEAQTITNALKAQAYKLAGTDINNPYASTAQNQTYSFQQLAAGIPGLLEAISGVKSTVPFGYTQAGPGQIAPQGTILGPGGETVSKEQFTQQFGAPTGIAGQPAPVPGTVAGTAVGTAGQALGGSAAPSPSKPSPFSRFSNYRPTAIPEINAQYEKRLAPGGGYWDIFKKGTNEHIDLATFKSLGLNINAISEGNAPPPRNGQSISDYVASIDSGISAGQKTISLVDIYNQRKDIQDMLARAFPGQDPLKAGTAANTAAPSAHRSHKAWKLRSTRSSPSKVAYLILADGFRAACLKKF